MDSKRHFLLHASSCGPFLHEIKAMLVHELCCSILPLSRHSKSQLKSGISQLFSFGNHYFSTREDEETTSNGARKSLLHCHSLEKYTASHMHQEVHSFRITWSLLHRLFCVFSAMHVSLNWSLVLINHSCDITHWRKPLKCSSSLISQKAVVVVVEPLSYHNDF